MIGSTLAELPQGARVGTGSLRRIAQLHAARPDLNVEPVRGNVDTRLRKLDEGQFDSIVLAAAGLRRLGWADRISEYLSPEVMCPAAGQGALAIETRADGGMAQQAVARLDHPETHAAVTAERAVLTVLGGGCQVPVGAHASVEGTVLSLIAVVSSPDGKTLVRRHAEARITSAQAMGEELGRELLAGGAAEILSAVYG
jgi:hydroxymethylbilane synthase